MRVVPLTAFEAHGRIPRSSDGLARKHAKGDVVVFVSHRWWGPGTPDVLYEGADGREVGGVKYPRPRRSHLGDVLLRPSSLRNIHVVASAPRRPASAKAYASQVRTYKTRPRRGD